MASEATGPSRPWLLCLQHTERNAAFVKTTVRPQLDARKVLVEERALTEAQVAATFVAVDFEKYAGTIVCGSDLEISQLLQSLLSDPRPAARTFPVALVSPPDGAHTLAASLANSPAKPLEAVVEVLATTLRTHATDVLCVDVAGARHHALVGVGLGLFRAPSIPDGAFVPTPLHGQSCPAVEGYLDSTKEGGKQHVLLHGLLLTRHPKIGSLHLARLELAAGLMSAVLVPQRMHLDCLANVGAGGAIDVASFADTTTVRKFGFQPIQEESASAALNIDGWAVALPAGTHMEVTVTPAAITFVHAREKSFAMQARASLPSVMARRETQSALDFALPPLAAVPADENDDDDTAPQTAVLLVKEYSANNMVQATCTRHTLIDIDINPSFAQTASRAELNAAVREAVNSALHKAQQQEKQMATVGTAAQTSLPGTPLSASGSSRVFRRPAMRKRQEDSIHLRPDAVPQHDRKYLIIYNPVSGSGRAKSIVNKILKPALHSLDVTIFETQHRGHATEHVASHPDISQFAGIIVCGGDGMVSETVTGLMSRPTGIDVAKEKLPPLALIPVGTANAMAHELNGPECDTFEKIVQSTLSAMLGNQTRAVDVLSIKGSRSSRYALSCVGWGLAGAVGQQADKLRWLPGQRSARYDIAGFITMMKDWPLSCRADFSYIDADTKQVVDVKSIRVVNLIASSLPKLGVDHPIHPDLRPDDGRIAVCLLDDTHSRRETVSTALAMKRGSYLGTMPEMRTFMATAFTLRPVLGALGADVPFNIDGDPFESQDISVTVMKRALYVFAPDLDSPVRRQASSQPFSNLVDALPFHFRTYTHEDLPNFAEGAWPVTRAESVTHVLSWTQAWLNAAPWTCKPLADLITAAKDSKASLAGPLHVWCSFDSKAAVDYVVAPMLRASGLAFRVDTLGDEDARLALGTLDATYSTTLSGLVVCGSKKFIHDVIDSVVYGSREEFPGWAATQLAALPVTSIPVSFEHNAFVPNGTEKFNLGDAAFPAQLMGHVGQCVLSLLRGHAPNPEPLANLQLAEVAWPTRGSSFLTFASWNVPELLTRMPLADINLTRSLDCRITITTACARTPQVLHIAVLFFFATTLNELKGFRIHPEKSTLDGRMALVIGSTRLLPTIRAFSHQSLEGAYLSDFANAALHVIPDVTTFSIELLGSEEHHEEMLLDGLPYPFVDFTARVRPEPLAYHAKRTCFETLVSPAGRPIAIRTAQQSMVLPVTQLLAQATPLAAPSSSPCKEVTETRSIVDEEEGLPLPVPANSRSIASYLSQTTYHDWVTQYSAAMQGTEAAGKKFALLVTTKNENRITTKVVSKLVQPLLSAAGLDISPVFVDDDGAQLQSFVKTTTLSELNGIILCGDDAFVSQTYTRLHALSPEAARVVLSVLPLGDLNFVASLAVPSMLGRNDRIAHCLYRALLCESRPATTMLVRSGTAEEPRIGLAALDHGLTSFLSLVNGAKDGPDATAIASSMRANAIRGILTYTDEKGAARSVAMPKPVSLLVVSPLSRLGPVKLASRERLGGKMVALWVYADTPVTKLMQLAGSSQPLKDLLGENAIVATTLEFTILDARTDEPPLALDCMPLADCSAISVQAQPHGASLFA